MKRDRKMGGWITRPRKGVQSLALFGQEEAFEEFETKQKLGYISILQRSLWPRGGKWIGSHARAKEKTHRPLISGGFAVKKLVLWVRPGRRESLSIGCEEQEEKEESRRSLKRHTAADRAHLFRGRDFHSTEPPVRKGQLRWKQLGQIGGVRRNLKMNPTDGSHFLCSIECELS